MADDDKDLRVYSGEPPQDSKEWSRVWRAVSYSERMWVVVGPIHAWVTNWKTWCAGAGIAVFVKGDDMMIIFREILVGLGQ